MTMRYGVVALGGFAVLAVGAVAQQDQKPLTVAVAKAPAQHMIYGMDFERLWYWNRLKPEEKTRLADIAVKECRVQYVRVAVRGLAEPEEGVFKPEAYDRILEMMTRVKAARPDIQFFGSPRPISGDDGGGDLPFTCYPLWITKFSRTQQGQGGEQGWTYNGFDPDKAADYMVRYLRFMKSKGFKITYLDLKNEIDKRVEPEQLKQMSERLKKEMGAECPTLLSPSSWDYKGGHTFLKQSVQQRCGTDYYDIATVHNTGDRGLPLSEFVAAAAEQGKIVWNTELHGWAGPDDRAVTNTVFLFHQIRSGVSGINDWLSLSSAKAENKMFRAMRDGSLEVMRIYAIYKQLVNTSGGGRYLPTTVPEGLDSSVAFVRGKLMTVWLLNGRDVPVKSLTVDLGGRSVAGASLRNVWWGPDTPREGLSGTVSVRAKSPSFVCDVAARTLLCLEFEIE